MNHVKHTAFQHGGAYVSICLSAFVTLYQSVCHQSYPGANLGCLGWRGQ